MVAKITQSYAMKGFKSAPWIGGGGKLAANATQSGSSENRHNCPCCCILHQLKLPDPLQGQPHIEHITVVQSGSDLRYECLWAELPNPGMGATDIQHEVMQKPSQTWVNITYSSSKNLSMEGPPECAPYQFGAVWPPSKDDIVLEATGPQT